VQFEQIIGFHPRQILVRCRLVGPWHT
jgi:hypothetical protein